MSRRRRPRRSPRAVGEKAVDLKWGDEFVGVSPLERPDVRFEGEAVFIGHGITAPEFKWDDFKGVDVTDKVVVLFTNEPPSNDPKFFDGRALTYYGRWTYKYEEALRHGARGGDHHPHHADGQLRLGRGAKLLGPRDAVRETRARREGALACRAGSRREAGDKLLGLANHTVDELLAASEKPDFKPIDLGIQIRGHMPSKIREIETRNVAAIIPGSDPKLKDEAVIFSAHWDHLGIGTPVNGDNIYNGAIDNATGCAILLELARVWGSLPQKPKRSALFLAVTAEEGGLRGSEYYAAHPLIPPAKTAIALNYDALYPWGKAKDMVLTGAERTTASADGAADREAARSWRSRPTRRPEAGHYFRSDHFSFAHAGIPAFSHRTRHRIRRQTRRLGQADVRGVQRASTITSLRTNSRRTGISPRCSRPRSSASCWAWTSRTRRSWWTGGRGISSIDRRRLALHRAPTGGGVRLPPWHGRRESGETGGLAARGTSSIDRRRLGFHRAPAGGGVRLPPGHGRREPGEAGGLAAGRSVPP